MSRQASIVMCEAGGTGRFPLIEELCIRPTKLGSLAIKMASRSITYLPVSPVTSTSAFAPTPHRRLNLRTLARVQREMAAVYKDMRAQTIDSQNGARLIYVLSQIGKLIKEETEQTSTRTYEDYLAELHTERLKKNVKSGCLSTS